MALGTAKLIGEKAATPTAYVIKKLDLFANNENKFDIRSLVNKITITESIYGGSIEVDLIITDAVNLIEQLKLNGQEKLNIVIGRTDLDDKNISKFDINVYIAQILNYARTKPGSATYELRCLSKHMFVNNTKVIGRGFEGTPGSLIKNICGSDLSVSKKKLENISGSGHTIKGIYPKLRPFAAIKWLTRNSFDAKGSPYYFYETAAGGLHFKSYIDMIESDPYNNSDNEEYIHNPFFKAEAEIGTEEHYSELKRRIRKLSSELNMSKYISTGEGAFASKLHYIDIYNKEYNTEKFTYNNMKLNSGKPFHDGEFEQYGNRAVQQCAEGKNYFVSTNSGNKNNYSSPLKQNLLKGQSYLANEDIISHDITLPGDFKLQPGMIVKMKYLKNSLENKTSDYYDKMLTGKYLVTSIIHEFQSEYTMNIRVKTDSFGSDLTDILTSEADNA